VSLSLSLSLSLSQSFKLLWMNASMVSSLLRPSFLTSLQQGAVTTGGDARTAVRRCRVRAVSAVLPVTTLVVSSC
jgi:hypothetical protein